ncbi:phospholipase D delta-like isoform X2 [Magnolia sinica]|uniref:phospholipase D delta-like isoform X2 n=1 Tax=Magnolia sinica TaxID=86752 RepID=UPI00265A5583|nr:phospholipase D delta-like isoform X2 [Magnolia sinica]
MSASPTHAPESGAKGVGAPEKIVFLHGDLDLWIYEAKSLPNMDLMSERMRRCFTMFGSCKSPFGNKDKQRSRHAIITSDPYVSVCLAGATIAQTRVIANCEDPTWEEHFFVPVAHPVARVEFQVKDNDILGAQLIGIVSIPVETILSGNMVKGWFPVVGPYGNSMKQQPELYLSLKFRPFENNPLYKDGVGAGPEYSGVPNTYFPLRTGGKVTLYQDAHVPDEMLPEIQLDNGRVFRQGKCWEDICHAILEAHHLIYIVGWSIYHRVKLVREPSKPLPSGGELSLGDLLKYKSAEGVRVILLIWDDKTSHDRFLLKTEGVMQTHDEETRKFFKHSTVHCVLCPRYASNKLSIFKQQVVGTLFTHHQKCVLLDTQASGNNRKITAFIGGLDLCDGRYDTPEHRLFQDLSTVFAGDFHNPTFPARARCPRQPWHDLHCKIEGPAAYDVMTNFEQRWRKATKWREFRLKKVFRSIDSGSVKGFPKSVQEAEEKNLVCGKNLKIDRSIHSAYVNAIRSAQHFIYIENQYFLGSSYYWPSYKNAGADNLVPMELALKIASKISANERFAVYVVLPMWPEGVPSSGAVQEILFWQGQTMEMMYRIVAQAIQKAGLSNKSHPQDYLNFYCLGKREIGQLERSDSSTSNSESNASGMAQKFRRFMIYVHSKGMVVDDEYVVVGSANINQRSLDGSRDTEIAMGAYQPNYTWAGRQGHPHGEVYGYRMSLWAEHLGFLEDSFQEPQTIECVSRINDLAEHNWQTYVSPDNSAMKGHLLKYPVQVERDGNVGPLPGFEFFPDVGGKILGAHSTLPDALTT